MALQKESLWYCTFIFISKIQALTSFLEISANCTRGQLDNINSNLRNNSAYGTKHQI